MNLNTQEYSSEQTPDDLGINLYHIRSVLEKNISSTGYQNKEYADSINNCKEILYKEKLIQDFHKTSSYELTKRGRIFLRALENVSYFNGLIEKNTSHVNIKQFRNILKTSILDIELFKSEFHVDEKTLKQDSNTQEASFKPTFYAVGFMWGRKNDQSERFFKEGIWESGKSFDHDKVSSVNTGDVLVLKTSYPDRHKKVNFLRIKALGLVSGKDPNNINKLNVKWHVILKHYKEFEGLGSYASTLSKISKSHLSLIFDQLEDQFNYLLSKVQKPPKARESYNLNLQKDAAAEIDELGREPFAEAMTQYISRLWKASFDEDSYTLHLNGEWGSGKSTVMCLLKKKLESNHNWLVVEFNAWQNQHLKVPWWVFLDRVYKAILKDSNGLKKIKVYSRENWWRTISMNSGRWFTFLVLLIAAILTSTVGTGFLQIDQFSTLELKNKLSVVTSILSLLGTVWLFFSGLIHSLLPGSESAALNFKQNVRDPMAKIQNHYRSVLKYTSKNVAVFIDDIDRCNPKYLVELLEGLQTLFRKEKVLYLIAGDAEWIRKSFEIHYHELKETLDRPGQSLGHFFVEKTLQHSIHLPPITEELKKAFWNKLLGGNTAQIDESQFLNRINEVHQATNSHKLTQIISQAESPEEKVALRNAAAAKVSSDEIIKEIEHELLKYHELLDTNPRRIKRLVNNLALQKVTHILSGLDEKIDRDSSIRWAILRSQFPVVAQEIIKDNSRVAEYLKSSTHFGISNILRGFKEESLKYMKP